MNCVSCGNPALVTCACKQFSKCIRHYDLSKSTCSTHPFDQIELIFEGTDSMKAYFDTQSRKRCFLEILSIYLNYFTIDSLDWMFIKLKSKNLKPSVSVQYILDTFIEYLSPLSSKFDSIEDLTIYTQRLKSLKSHLLEFIPESKPKRFNMLEILIEVCNLGNKELVFKIASKMRYFFYDGLFSQSMFSFIIDNVEKTFICDSIPIRIFKEFYFKKAIEPIIVPNKNGIDTDIQLNHEVIHIIIYSITTKNSKYSYLFIRDLVDLSKLLSIIEDGERNLQEFKGLPKNMNKYLEEIYEAVEKLDLNSPFCELISKIIKSFEFEIDDYKQGYALKGYFNYFSGNCTNKINLLIASSRVQFYLNKLACLLNEEKSKLNSNKSQIMQELINALSTTSLHTYDLYLLKILRGFKANNTLELAEYCSKLQYKWKLNFTDLKIQLPLSVFPINENVANSEKYSIFVIKINNLIRNPKEMDEVIQQPQECNCMLELGLAFMNSVYLMHSLPNFDPSPYKTWYESACSRIVQNFGQAFASLLKQFIYNYSADNLCYIKKGANNNIAMLINYITLLCISYSKVPNYFSKQFFTSTGQLLPNLSEYSQEIYYIGTETNDIHNYLKFLNDNFEMMKSRLFHTTYAKSGFYICSDTCDHMYIINNCGAPVVESNCCFCGNKIGGINHRLIERTEHRNVSDDEAKAFLNQKLPAYRAAEPKGFPNYSKNIWLSIPRNLTSLCTFPLLNFFTNSVFYFLYSTNIYPVEHLEVVYNIEQLNLKEVIESNLIENFKSFINLEESDFIFKLLGTINKFKDVMLDFTGDPWVKNDRDTFEMLFEKKILAQSFKDLAIEYKRCLNTQTRPSQLIKYIEETEIPQENLYKHSELFIYRPKATWDSLKQAFNMSQKKGEFLILGEFIENFEDLQSLSLLWPIAKFSNEMIQRCSFVYSRAEAQKQTIGEFLRVNNALIPSFLEFSKAWEKLQMTLNFDCKSFNKVTISENSSLGYLLAETKIDSLGIQLAAALRMLCELQNRFCLLLTKNNSNLLKINSFTDLSKEDIFIINPLMLESMIQNCSSNCLEYGKGQNIFYDFQQFEYEISRYLSNAKFIDFKKIEFIHYQFEIFSPRSIYAGTLMNIRENIPLESLSSNDILVIKNQVKLKSELLNVDSKKIWTQSYAWLGLVCLHTLELKNLSQTKLQAFDGLKTNFIEEFRVFEIFQSFSINKLISIYEYIELEIYPEVLKSISPQYKVEFPSLAAANASLNLFYNKICQDLSSEIMLECLKVLRRIIIRVLTAYTSAEFRIIDYLKLETFWSKEFEDYSEKVCDYFPNDFLFSNAVTVEKLIEKKIEF